MNAATGLPLAMLLAVLASQAVATEGAADMDEAAVLAGLERQAPRMAAVAQALWERPELGYLETESSARLQAELRAAGFQVQAGIAGMPTAFVARAGHPGNGPVIALLAEMDALPGASQAALAVQQPQPGVDAGHACGHNLFGAASVAAAIAIADWLQASGSDGEVRLYGTPAEEGGSGKVFLVKHGAFDEVDVVLHWHPDAVNSASQGSSLANISAKFGFQGVAAHAAIAPERGRSALDGVEALDFMANLMREHVPDGTRIHYSISHGGGAPNVVPARAEAWYYVRHPDPKVVQDVMARLRQAADGAALGTGTTVAFEPVGGVHSLLRNDTLGRVLDAALHRVGGVAYDAGDQAFAHTLQQGLHEPPSLRQAAEVAAYDPSPAQGMASTDVGDVSWVVPTAGLSVATWVPGTSAHTWQATAASGHAIGAKGALVAAKAMALAAIGLYCDPATVAAARDEFERRRGPGYRYQSLLQADTPPLDYRHPPR